MALLLKQDCWKMAPFEESHLVVDEGGDQEQMLADRQERERRLRSLKRPWIAFRTKSARSSSSGICAIRRRR